MNNFGDFLYKLRKEKGITQAELAQILGVTNKAVSKWETGEAMPETSLLLPIARTFGVTVDELLNGSRAEHTENEPEPAPVPPEDEIKAHLFTRGNDEPPKTRADAIVGAVCGGVFFAGMLAYLLLGALANLWHPWWIIVTDAALLCGLIGTVYDVCNPLKRARRMAKGENPYTGAACGIIMLTCVITYITASVFTNLWHPLWVIVCGGGIACFVVGTLGDFLFLRK
ncbi:MAG: helix-turn-helix transcriptional regulator [Clostridia bacterium]|nr:helix-turn-helix transcriptional regulator [Clostridia bacterium]